MDLLNEDIVNDIRVCFNCNNDLIRELAAAAADNVWLNLIV